MIYSGSDAKFWEHLPAILLIHVLAINREDVHPENNREALTKFMHRIQSRAWENEPNLHKFGWD